MWFRQDGHATITAYDAPAPSDSGPVHPGTTITWDFASLPARRPHRCSSGPAHDLNSMLTAILGFVQLGRMRANDPAGVQDELDAIDVAARRAVHLVRELVISEFCAGAEPGTADPNEVIGDLLPVMQRLASPCQIIPALHPDAPRANLPRDAMARVVFNLVLNAREAMPTGGRISLSTHPSSGALESGDAGSAGELTLTVRDTGVGMDEPTLLRIFEPHFTTKTPGRGNGLGLVTVRDILQAAHGRVVVTSAPGLGTTFTVHLAATRRL